MRAFSLCLALGLCTSGCSDRAAPGPIPTQGTTSPPAVEHDFGVIPHGESRRHDFVLDLAVLGGSSRYVPLRVQLDCSCGRGQLLLRNEIGVERVLDGSPASPNAPTAGETLVVRVVVDTLTKDAVDLPPTTSRGYVVLQPTHDRDGSLRVLWPLLLRFGIDAPVVLRPFAALDFARVPVSGPREILTTLRGDDKHPGVRFGPVTSTDPHLDAVLEPDGDGVLVRARVRPGELGNHRAVLSIGTDLPSGYRVNLGATWKVVPDLEAMPLPKLSFYADLRREQRPDECQGQFLLVVDHDAQRNAEFTVHELVADDGRDAAACFAVTFAPVPNQPRQQRVSVRYLGGRPEGFRGRLVLTKGGKAGPFLPIELVAFPRNKDS